MLFSKILKISFVLLLIGILHLNVNAQIGLTSAYATMNAPNWQKSLLEGSRLNVENDFRWSPSYKIGIDYQIKILPKSRLYIQPSLYYSRFSESRYNIHYSWSDSYTIIKSELIEVNLNANIYPFDLEGDCNCPTFSKDGNVIKKGFFIQVLPGLTYAKNTIDPKLLPHESEYTRSDYVSNLGIGVGLDLGISDFITITPFARLRRHFNVEWKFLNNYLTPDFQSSVIENDSNDSSNIDQFEAGIRIEYRWKN